MLKTEMMENHFWSENKVQRAKVTLDQTLETHWRHSVAMSCLLCFHAGLVSPQLALVPSHMTHMTIGGACGFYCQYCACLFSPPSSLYASNELDGWM